MYNNKSRTSTVYWSELRLKFGLKTNESDQENTFQWKIFMFTWVEAVCLCLHKTEHPNAMVVIHPILLLLYSYIYPIHRSFYKVCYFIFFTDSNSTSQAFSEYLERCSRSLWTRTPPTSKTIFWHRKHLLINKILFISFIFCEKLSKGILISE